jgi:HAD superfamily hydrolase (TIGR01458 family)
MTTRGVLIDLDGVLYLGGRAIPGAHEAIDYLIDKRIPFRCISNTTRKCRKTICLQLSKMGFDIPEEFIFTPPQAAIAHMQCSGKRAPKFFLLTTGDVDRDFAGAGIRDSETAEYVIVGDAGDAASYDTLNKAFRLLMDGAELIALEKDRYWMAEDGLCLSAGPFVSALEFATGKQATVMGKPSRRFFELALKDMHLHPEDVSMIGDDIQTDVGGAQAAGMTGILVRTGKFREDVLQNAPVRPDMVIDSIADLQTII